MIERRVFGSETEYGLTILANNGQTYEPFSHQKLECIMSVSRPSEMPVADPAIDRRLYTLGANRDYPSNGYVSSGYLSNGAREYVDMAHPEYATPEVVDATDMPFQEQAGERIITATMDNAVTQGLIRDYKLDVLVSDMRDTSWGYHENYQVERNILNPHHADNPKSPQAQRWQLLGGFLLSRPLVVGEGGLMRTGDIFEYVLTTKVMHTRCDIDDETTAKPLINIRDRSYMDSLRYSRLHIVSGAPNRNPWGTFMTFGTMKLFLDGLEAGLQPERSIAFKEKHMHHIARHIARTTNGQAIVPLRDGTTISAPDLQYLYLGMAKELAQHKNLTDSDKVTLTEWEATLDTLTAEHTTTRQRGLNQLRLEWLLKRKMMQKWAVPVPKHHSPDTAYFSAGAAGFAYDWAKVAPQSVATKLRHSPNAWGEWQPPEAAIQKATVVAPQNTRAALRGKYVMAFADVAGAALGWHLLANPFTKDLRARFIYIKDPLTTNSPQLNALIAEA